MTHHNNTRRFAPRLGHNPRRIGFRFPGAAGLLALVLLLPGCVKPGRSAPLPANGEVTIASYNIKHGLGMDGAIDLERTARVLDSLDADVIALQEVDVRARRSDGVDQPAWLGERLEMTPVFGSFMPFQGGRYGLALLSRLPILGHEVWRLADGNEPRVALAVRIEDANGLPFTVVVVHFDWVADDSYRFRQAEETLARLREIDGPWVVIGDFNDVPGSRTMNAFARSGAIVPKKPGSPPTFPSVAPRIDIDHVVTGPGDSWPDRTVTVIDEQVASDHRPLRTRVAPPS